MACLYSDEDHPVHRLPPVEDELQGSLGDEGGFDIDDEALALGAGLVPLPRPPSFSLPSHLTEAGSSPGGAHELLATAGGTAAVPPTASGPAPAVAAWARPWNCRSCTLENRPGTLMCGVCGSERPDSEREGAPPPWEPALEAAAAEAEGSAPPPLDAEGAVPASDASRPLPPPRVAAPELPLEAGLEDVVALESAADAVLPAPELRPLSPSSPQGKAAVPLLDLAGGLEAAAASRRVQEDLDAALADDELGDACELQIEALVRGRLDPKGKLVGGPRVASSRGGPSVGPGANAAMPLASARLTSQLLAERRAALAAGLPPPGIHAASQLLTTPRRGRSRSPGRGAGDPASMKGEAGIDIVSLDGKGKGRGKKSRSKGPAPAPPDPWHESFEARALRCMEDLQRGADLLLGRMRTCEQCRGAPEKVVPLIVCDDAERYAYPFHEGSISPRRFQQGRASDDDFAGLVVPPAAKQEAWSGNWWINEQPPDENLRLKRRTALNAQRSLTSATAKALGAAARPKPPKPAPQKPQRPEAAPPAAAAPVPAGAAAADTPAPAAASKAVAAAPAEASTTWFASLFGSLWGSSAAVQEPAPEAAEPGKVDDAAGSTKDDLQDATSDAGSDSKGKGKGKKGKGKGKDGKGKDGKGKDGKGSMERELSEAESGKGDGKGNDKGKGKGKEKGKGPESPRSEGSSPPASARGDSMGPKGSKGGKGGKGKGSEKGAKGDGKSVLGGSSALGSSAAASLLGGVAQGKGPDDKGKGKGKGKDKGKDKGKSHSPSPSNSSLDDSPPTSARGKGKDGKGKGKGKDGKGKDGGSQPGSPAAGLPRDGSVSSLASGGSQGKGKGKDLKGKGKGKGGASVVGSVAGSSAAAQLLGDALKGKGKGKGKSKKGPS